MGLANSKSGEYWYGILGVKSKERRTIIQRLVEKGNLITIGIDEFPDEAVLHSEARFIKYDQLYDLKTENIRSIHNCCFGQS